MKRSKTLLGAALLAMLVGCASDQKKPANNAASGSGHGSGHAGAHGGHTHPHGAMHHRFDNAEKWAKRFDSPKRARWQKPDAVVAKLKLAPDAHVADIGAGTGYFAVRLARAAPKGTTYGIDIEKDMVTYLGKRAEREGVKNLQPVLASTSDAKIPAPVDMVFVCDTYHHIDARTKYFKAVADKLKPGGRLVIVDFKMGKIPVGPPEKHRVTPATLHEELAAAGYSKVEVDETTLPYQYIAIYTKK